MIIINWYMEIRSNIRLEIEGQVSVDKMGFTDYEWEAMDETEQAECVKEAIFENVALGWREETV